MPSPSVSTPQPGAQSLSPASGDAAESRKNITVIVKPLVGKETRCDMAPSATINDLKAAMEEKTGSRASLMRFAFNGKPVVQDGATLTSLGIEDGSLVHLMPGLRKPVIYLMPPTPTDMVVKVGLKPQWSFSAIYPPAPVVPGDVKGGEHVEWHVRANPGGLMTDDNGIECTYLFWEGPSETPIEEGVFDPSHPVLGPENAVLLRTSNVVGYLYRELTKLGLDAGARTDFITYWLADFNAHDHIALRFVPQKEYARAAPLETEPAAEATTRIFMLFRGVSAAETADEAQWAGAQQDVDWSSVVGVDPRMADKSLLRVLEWGGMQVV